MKSLDEIEEDEAVDICLLAIEVEGVLMWPPGRRVRGILQVSVAVTSGEFTKKTSR